MEQKEKSQLNVDGSGLISKKLRGLQKWSSGWPCSTAVFAQILAGMKFNFWTGINRERISLELEKKTKTTKPNTLKKSGRGLTCCMFVPEGLLSSSSWRCWVLLSAWSSCCWSCRNCSLGTVAQPCCCWELWLRIPPDWSIWKIQKSQPSAPAPSARGAPGSSLPRFLMGKRNEPGFNNRRWTGNFLPMKKDGVSHAALRSKEIWALIHHFRPEL